MQASWQSILHATFGLSQLRPYQERVVTTLLGGRDVVAVLPTGAGKSLCYQLPALCLPGLTLVVSPLLALMNDQVRSLTQRGIAAAAWTSELRPRDVHTLCSRLLAHEVKLLYISPEKLANSSVRDQLCALTLSMIAVDEAHCISSWGHEFRPDYRRIPEFLRAYVGHTRHRPIVAAFTATARQVTVRDVSTTLGLHQPTLIALPLWRPNLRLVCARPPARGQLLDGILTVLRSWRTHGAGSALIYAGTRKTCEHLAFRLRQFGFSAQPFHAGLTAERKNHLLSTFRQRPRQVLVTTTAFGMGIDIPDIRLVIHALPPTSLEDYAQEVGRAGRDGQESWCVLFIHPELLEEQLGILLDSAAKSRHPLLKKRAYELYQFATGNHCLGQVLAKTFALPGTSAPDFASCQCGHCVPQLPWFPPPKAPKNHWDPLAYRLWSDLRTCRMRKAKQLRVPAFYLGTDAMLRAIAREKPTSWFALRCIGGIGHARLFYWGKDILALCSTYAQAATRTTTELPPHPE